MMEDAYNQMNSIVDDIVDSVDRSKDIVNDLYKSQCWDGNGYNYYKDRFNNLCENFGAFCNDLYKLNNGIKEAISNLKETDKQMSRG